MKEGKGREGETKEAEGAEAGALCMWRRAGGRVLLEGFGSTAFGCR